MNLLLVGQGVLPAAGTILDNINSLMFPGDVIGTVSRNTINDPWNLINIQGHRLI